MSGPSPGASGLGRRVATALVLLILVLAGLFWLPAGAFALVFALVTLLAGWEWGALAASGKATVAPAFVAALAVWLVTLWLVPEFRMAALWTGAVGWGFGCALVLAHRISAPWFRRPSFILASGLLVLGAAWTALIEIRGLPDGAGWLLWLFLLVWIADIGAYFAGRRFGRRPLAPVVSPRKTWEGAVGGGAASLIVALTGLLILPPAGAGVTLIVPVLIVLSMFGDLFESALKRAVGVKDSGNLLPGHGGVLDRVDSLLAVLPPFALVLAWSS